MKKIVKFIMPQVIIFIILGCEMDFIFSFLFIFIHEVTHVLVARVMKMDLKKLICHPIGFTIGLDEIEDLSENQKMILYGSGPFANFILALFFYCLYNIYFNEIFIVFSSINLVLGIFNLIPAFPLDGSHILKIILSKFLLYKEACKITICFSFAISFVLMGIFIYFIRSFNVTILLSAILIFITTLEEKKNTMYIIMGDMSRKRIRLINKGYIYTKTICVNYDKELINLLSLIDKNKFNIFYIVDHELNVLTILREDELLEVLKKKGNMEIKTYLDTSIDN